MNSQATSDPKPTLPRHERPAGARGIDTVPTRLLVLAAAIAAWRWITSQPPQVSADVLQVLLLMAMGALGAKLVSELVADLRGKEAMEVLATLGQWTAAACTALVYLLLIAGVLTVVCYSTGLTMLDLLRLAGLNV
jgi:hypothetical protein